MTCPVMPEFDLPSYLLCMVEEDFVIDTEMQFYERMKKGEKEVASSAHKTPSPYIS